MKTKIIKKDEDVFNGKCICGYTGLFIILYGLLQDRIQIPKNLITDGFFIDTGTCYVCPKCGTIKIKLGKHG